MTPERGSLVSSETDIDAKVMAWWGEQGKVSEKVKDVRDGKSRMQGRHHRPKRPILPVAGMKCGKAVTKEE